MHGGFYAPGIEVLCLVIDELQISKVTFYFKKVGSMLKSRGRIYANVMRVWDKRSNSNV